MPQKFSLATMVALPVALALGAAAHAQPTRQPFMPLYGVADAPNGFLDMCKIDRVVCAAGMPLSDAIVARTDETDLDATGAISLGSPVQRESGRRQATALLPLERGMDWVRLVNNDVNRMAIQQTDDDLYGVGELWRRPAAGKHPAGDCEDLAIEKRMRLIEAGFPASRLFFGIAYHRNMGLHTVLVARLDDADYVLDNMTSHIRRWDQTPYTWLRAQSTQDPMQWLRVDTSPRSYITHSDYSDEAAIS